MLICRIGDCACALPVESIGETMRPLPIEPIGKSPPFVLGAAVIRGAAVPVIDATRLFGVGAPNGPSTLARFVTIKVAARQVALAVDEVIGIRAMPAVSLEGMPPLLRDAEAAAISALNVLDTELLLVLGDGRAICEDAWRSIALELAQ